MARFDHASSAGFLSSAVLASLLVAGCHGSTTTSAQFTGSATAPAPGLVKLVQKSRSGSHLIVDVVVYGPEPGLDLSGFRFDVRIGDASVVRLAAQSTYTQTALVPADGQAIAISVDGASDPSLVQVDVHKEGGGAGNGVPGASAVVIELPFNVQSSGASSLALVGHGADPPAAVDSAGATIDAVVFDGASASVRGVTTGGGGY